MSYLTPMRKTPLRRVAMLVLLLAVVTGWSAQAYSLVTSGSCVGAMTGMDMNSAMPMDSSSDSDDGMDAMPCKGIVVRCMNSLGCIVSVALPQAFVVVDGSELFGAPNALAIGDLTGLSLRPELSPPIHTA